MSNRKFYAILAALTANALLMLVVLLFFLLGEPITGVSQPLLAPAKAEVPKATGLTLNHGELLVILLIAGVPGIVGTTTYFAIQGRRVGARRAGLRLIAGRASQPWTELRAGQLRIGRGQDNELQVFDPNVSHCHAVIRAAKGRFYLQVQDSMHNTYVNNQPVEAIALRDGDRIQIGQAELSFCVVK